MVTKGITIAMMLAALATADARAETPVATDAGDKNWLTLDQFLQQAPTQVDAPAGQTQMVLLPSLGPQAVARQAASAPAAIKPVELAALPPLFERPKPQPKLELKKTAAGKQVLPKLVAEVQTPAAPVAPESCAKPTPEMTQKAKNYASDSATLEALHRAVQDLQLNDKMDFLLPAKTSGPVKSDKLPAVTAKP